MKVIKQTTIGGGTIYDSENNRISNYHCCYVLYTYCTEFEDIRPGQKVIVPFSIHNKATEGYVARVLDGPPEGVKKIKAVREVANGPELSEEAVKTALWMRDRFLCRYIEAVKCSSDLLFFLLHLDMSIYIHDQMNRDLLDLR